MAEEAMIERWLKERGLDSNADLAEAVTKQKSEDRAKKPDNHRRRADTFTGGPGRGCPPSLKAAC